jgi:hypothetical protein
MHIFRYLVGPLPEVSQSPNKVRVLGAIGAFLGMTILGIMGWVMYWTIPAMNAAGAEAANGLTFTGGPGTRTIVLGIFALVSALGLSFVIAGTLMLATGRRFAIVTRLMLWLVAAFLLLGTAVKSGLLG